MWVGIRFSSFLNFVYFSIFKCKLIQTYWIKLGQKWIFFKKTMPFSFLLNHNSPLFSHRLGHLVCDSTPLTDRSVGRCTLGWRTIFPLLPNARISVSICAVWSMFVIRAKAAKPKPFRDSQSHSIGTQVDFQRTGNRVCCHWRSTGHHCECHRAQSSMKSTLEWSDWLGTRSWNLGLEFCKRICRKCSINMRRQFEAAKRKRRYCIRHRFQWCLRAVGRLKNLIKKRFLRIWNRLIQTTPTGELAMISGRLTLNDDDTSSTMILCGPKASPNR